MTCGGGMGSLLGPADGVYHWLGIELAPEGIRVTLRAGFPMTAQDAAADINRLLVEARLAVHRVELVSPPSP